MSVDVKSPFGGPENGAPLTATADFVTIYSVAAHATGDFGTSVTAERNMFQLLNLLMQKSNVKYLSVSSATVDLSVSANRTFYGLGTDYNQASTTVYTIKFVADQTGFVSSSILTTLLDTVALPYTTASVPITGPSTRSITAYDASGSATKNISFTVASSF